jgi:hypothetical protein
MPDDKRTLISKSSRTVTHGRALITVEFCRTRAMCDANVLECRVKIDPQGIYNPGGEAHDQGNRLNPEDPAAAVVARAAGMIREKAQLMIEAADDALAAVEAGMVAGIVPTKWSPLSVGGRPFEVGWRFINCGATAEEAARECRDCSSWQGGDEPRGRCMTHQREYDADHNCIMWHQPAKLPEEAPKDPTP